MIECLHRKAHTLASLAGFFGSRRASKSSGVSAGASLLSERVQNLGLLTLGYQVRDDGWQQRIEVTATHLPEKGVLAVGFAASGCTDLPANKVFASFKDHTVGRCGRDHSRPGCVPIPLALENHERAFAIKKPREPRRFCVQHAPTPFVYIRSIAEPEYAAMARKRIEKDCPMFTSIT